MPFPFRPVSPGQRVKPPSAQKENALMALVRNHQMQRVAPPSVRTEKRGSTGSGVILVKVTANESGGGKYEGYVLSEPAGVSASGTLAETEVGIYATGDEHKVMILNAAEVGKATHDLTEGTPQTTIFPAKLLSVTSDHATPRPVYVITGYDFKDCA